MYRVCNVIFVLYPNGNKLMTYASKIKVVSGIIEIPTGIVSA